MVPASFRNLWRSIKEKMQHTESYEDIFQLEAIGALLTLHNWPDALHSCCWIHWIDNAGAQASLISGSSSVYSGDNHGRDMAVNK